MRRPATILGPAATVLVLAAGLMCTTTTAVATDDPRPSSPASQRLAPGTWQQVSSGRVENFTEPGTFRTADGVLHVAWGTRRDPASPGASFTFATVHRGITPAGVLTPESDVVNGFASIGASPEITSRPGGIRVFVSAIKTTEPNQPRDSSGVFAYGSDETGATWAEEGTASTVGHDFAAVTFDDGTPLVAESIGGDHWWRTGFGELPPASAGSLFGSCCVYHPQLARSGATVLLGVDTLSNTAAYAGILVKQLSPAPGPLVQAPGSAVGYHFQGPGMATRTDGTIWLAYPTKTAKGAPLLLWQYGGAGPTTVPGSEKATWFDLGAAPDGRLWLVWGQADGAIKVSRTATSGTRFGAVTTWRPPTGTGGDFGMTIEPTATWADVLLVADTAATVTPRVFHTRVLPGLELAASPSRWRAGRAQRVRVRVTDAGAGVGGVRVRGGGETCRTGGSGTCTLRFGSRGPGRVIVRATAVGWVADSAVLRVRR